MAFAFCTARAAWVDALAKLGIRVLRAGVRFTGFLPGEKPVNRGRMDAPPLLAAQPFGQLAVGGTGLSQCDQLGPVPSELARTVPALPQSAPALADGGKFCCCVKSIAHK